MAMKAVKGHALVKTSEPHQKPLWRCECGAVYGAATGDDRMSRATARERHRVHLAEITGPMTVATEEPQKQY